MEHKITGECRHGVHKKAGDPCFYCAFCTIDGNDYSHSLRQAKPLDFLE